MRRKKLEVEGNRSRAIRHMDAESMTISGVATPCRSMPIDVHDQSSEFDRRRGRRMTPRFPLGIKQHNIACVLHRDRLVHGEDLMLRVRGGDGQSHCAAEWAIARQGKRRRGCNGDGPGRGKYRARPSRPANTSKAIAAPSTTGAQAVRAT